MISPRVPPEDAPPTARRKGGFTWRQSFSGAVIGAAIGITAHLLDASPWWWLAVPVGIYLGATLNLHVSVLWRRE